jgi:hypothetical protein
MKQKLLQRLDELRAELMSGRRMEAELEGRLAELRATLLRIGGAIQVLEELTDHDAAGPDAPQETAGASTHGSGAGASEH